ncbi:hypothetical protein SAMD00019534_050840 [Acytostelium subglobosum LB1]|uniref:hypothetical protein n=1 Tax=Acytostelium subglobosum LB1 TaxID=1410327 RepID=UPI000644F86F|nr:hypothetical protein SAMD00019534_050840 [Acytostelium subglobosum LB1]GAM21909.1 hypothetical protein SAMD00019534_050840 [Acytostelium subglobosum LB1]|eukprot:XP_012755009.1 hypothetical protein SAMD00019534_050840 [Acytostelium subglobosum LB1]
MKLFGRKKKDKGEKSQVNNGDTSLDLADNSFLQSLPARANRRYSMAYSSSPLLDPDQSLDDNGDIDTPEYYINSIEKQAGVEVLSSLCSTLQTKDSTWTRSLIELNGIELLLNVLQSVESCSADNISSDVILQSLAVTSLLHLMNTKFGIDKAIETPNAMNRLIMCLDTPKIDTRSSVIELLTAVCIVSFEGFRAVLQSFTYFKNVKKEKVRFFHLLDTMRTNQDDHEYLAIALALINGLVNTPEEVEERVQLRSELTRLSLDELIFKKKSIPYEEAPDLLTQIDVYEDEARADQEELMDRFAELDINIEDPKEVFGFILEQSEQHYNHPLISILQNLLTITRRTDSGLLSWFLIEKLIQQIAMSKEAIGIDDKVHLNLDDLLSASQPTVAMMTEQKRMADDLAKTRDQLKRVTFELNKATSELAARQQESSVIKSNMFNTVKIKNQELSKLKGQIRRMDAAFFEENASGVEDSKQDQNDFRIRTWQHQQTATVVKAEVW